MDKFAIDGHKLFWHLDRVAAWQKDRLITPVYVEISPLSLCNHNCVFCGLDFAHNEPFTLDTGPLLTRIKEMADLGVKSVMFAGEGEPLLHPEIVDIVRVTKECGIDVSITTNGMSGTHDLWESLLPYLTWIRFSIDAATPQIYQKVHQVTPDAFIETIASLKEALSVKQRLGIPVTIGVQFLLIEENLGDIEEGIRLYSRLGVDYLSFKPYSEHPQMLNKSGFSYDTKLIGQIEEAVKKHAATAKTAIIFRKTATNAYAEGTANFEHCCALPFWGYISARGDFYTCSVFLNDNRFKVGNIYEDTMEKLFFGERRKLSISYAEHELAIDRECRVNCRMARINEFLAFLNQKPDHINFI